MRERRKRGIRKVIGERRRSALFGGRRLEGLLVLDYLRTLLGRTSPPRPRMVQMEPTRECNLACSMCIREEAGVGAEMDLALFKKIVSRDLNYRHFLLLYGQGEPFLARSLFEMIRFERDRGNYVTTVTNGTIADGEVCRRLANSGLSMLRISIDGASEGTYGSIRRGARLAQVLRNVECLSGALRDRKAKTDLALTFMALKRNYHEMPDMVRLASQLGIRYLELKDLPPYAQSPLKPLVVEIGEDPALKDRLDSVLAETQRQARSRRITIIKSKLHCSTGTGACMNPWFKTFITWDGKVALCSRLCGPASPMLGDLNHIAFAQVWNGAVYRSVRARIKAGSLPLESCRTEL